MNILEEIQNCPVEWKELGEVVDVLDSLRRPITKSQRIPGGIPYYGANGIQDYVKDWIFDGTFILMGEDGSVIKNDNSPILHWVVGKIWVNNHAHILGEVAGCALLKYVYYVLSQTDVSDIVRGTPPKLNQKNLKSIKIPIPPLEIQEKIVQILDKFTDYVTELTSELTSRKKQYSYYRDKLLSFEDEVYQVEWKMLNEFLKKGKGTKITASQMKLLHKEGAPIRIFAGGKTYADVNYGDIPDKDIHTEEAIVVKSRGIIDFEYCTKPFSFKNEFWSYSSDDETINLRYIYHYLVHNKGHFQNIANNMQMPQISSNDTEKFKIPVPSLEIQSRIVQVLDNFDMVCNDLKIGLPKEIELRQKQYEYFREKLLTFVAEGEYTDSTVQYSTDKTSLGS
jgi:type I restriction enzyme ecoprrI specificity protein